MDFKYNTTREGDRLTLTLAGRLDTLSAAEFDKEVKRILDEEPAKSVTVQIADLDYISSSGLRCFVVLLKGTRGSGSELKIEGMQPAIREIFDLTGFTKLFGL